MVIQQRRRSVRVTAPVRYEVHSRKRCFSTVTDAVAEVIIHRAFTSYAILIPDRKKANWTGKPKFEAYLSGVVAGTFPFDGEGRGWGREADGLIQSMFWQGINAGFRRRARYERKAS